MRYLRLLLPSDHFSISDADGKTWLYLPATETPPSFEETHLGEYVDWGVQWSAESIEIDLAQYGEPKKLRLNAGPGFGDLSHPTTRLTLSLMAPLINGKEVLDIGCGSGILSFAAALMGAKKVTGIDIDPEALSHARENAEINQLPIQFLLPEEFQDSFKDAPVLLMNMIRTQQQEAWKSLPQIQGIAATYVTSGILATDRKRYMKDCAQRGWSVVEERQEGEWMGFVFTQASSP